MLAGREVLVHSNAGLEWLYGSFISYSRHFFLSGCVSVFQHPKLSEEEEEADALSALTVTWVVSSHHLNWMWDKNFESCWVFPSFSTRSLICLLSILKKLYGIINQGSFIQVLSSKSSYFSKGGQKGVEGISQSFPKCRQNCLCFHRTLKRLQYVIQVIQKKLCFG